MIPPLASAFLFAASLAASSAANQPESGTIAGHVVDFTGGALPGVAVRARCGSFDGTSGTDVNGDFAITRVPPGDCVISFESLGFKTRTVSAQISASRTTNINATLELRPVAENQPNYFLLPSDVSAGYAFAHDPKNDISLPVGWIGDGAVGLRSWLHAVGEASGNYKRTDLFGSEARLNVHTAMAGVRVIGRIGKILEFGQIAAGTIRSSGASFGVTETRYSFAVQPGVGFDYPITRRLYARFRVDVRFIRNGPDGNEGGYQYRFSTGLVYRKLYIFL